MAPRRITGNPANVADEKAVPIRNKDVVVVDETGVTVDGDVSAVGTVDAGAKLSTGGREITPTTHKIDGTASTWSTIIEGGEGRWNAALNSTPGAGGTFTHAQNAVQYRTHPTYAAIYFGDATGASVGDPVTWTLAAGMTFDPVGHLVDVEGDVVADNLEAVEVEATSEVRTPSVRQEDTTPGAGTRHDTFATAVPGGGSVHRLACFNDASSTGIMYNIASPTGGRWRFDVVVGGVTYQALHVGAPFSPYVGILKSNPQYPLEVAGQVAVYGVVYTPKAAASAALNETFVDSADGRLKHKDGAGVVHNCYP